MCTYWSCQHTYIPQEEATSPTIALEALFALLLIDAHERGPLNTFDVPGECIHASLPDDKAVHIKSEGEFVDIMCKVNPDYENFVRYEKGKDVLYVLILKAIYGMIYSALLLYDLFSTTLSDLGLKINPYEWCVSNKVID